MVEETFGNHLDPRWPIQSKANFEVISVYSGKIPVEFRIFPKMKALQFVQAALLLIFFPSMQS